MDVNGVLEEDEKIQDLVYRNAKYLHEGDTSRIIGQDAKLLNKRIVDSVEYDMYSHFRIGLSRWVIL